MRQRTSVECLITDQVHSPKFGSGGSFFKKAIAQSLLAIWGTAQMHDNKKKRIMVVERDMITALGFDFTVDNPKSLFRQKMQSLGVPLF